MVINCTCGAPLLKSYGQTVKLRSKSIRWEGSDTAIVQCNMCRGFNSLPLEFRAKGAGFVIELGNEVRKSSTERPRFIVEMSNKKH
jgi:hypothetical protein